MPLSYKIFAFFPFFSYSVFFSLSSSLISSSCLPYSSCPLVSPFSLPKTSPAKNPLTRLHLVHLSSWPTQLFFHASLHQLPTQIRSSFEASTTTMVRWSCPRPHISCSWAWKSSPTSKKKKNVWLLLRCSSKVARKAKIKKGVYKYVVKKIHDIICNSMLITI